MDEGRGLRMRAGAQRRRVGHVGGSRCTSVGRGTRRWGPACMGGQCAWEEGTHGRAAAHVGGGRHVKVRAERRGGGQEVWQGPEPCRRRARSRGWGPWSIGGATGGSGLGRVGRGRDTCEGIGTWVDGQVGSIVMGQRGRGATWLWGSRVVVVGTGGDTSPV